ncbi:MAG: segregation/condensation protein A [Aureispira sp.]|nr:segregation/condensation protein A [Aureispira sp.]
MTYKIKLPVFEGPFDLLLFFIERDELDIYDIPIAQITNDFLDYIKHLETLLNIDVASEFILVASTLMRIKAKMLLPRKELDEEGNEIDPRQELVERLLEYKRYKDVLDELRGLEQKRQEQHQRGNLVDELQHLANEALADAELENLSLFKLLKAYEDIMRQFKYRNEQVVHTVVHYNYSIEERRTYITNRIKTLGKTDFKEIFSYCENRLHAIFTFLAILELLQLEQITIVIHEGVNSFSLDIIQEDKED